MGSGFTGSRIFQIRNAKSVDAESKRPVACCPSHWTQGRLTIATPQEILAFNLRALRTSAGISQEELAHRARLHRTYISSIERGQRNISLENLFRIAEALGATPAQLLKPIPKTGR